MVCNKRIKEGGGGPTNNANNLLSLLTFGFVTAGHFFPDKVSVFLQFVLLCSF